MTTRPESAISAKFIAALPPAPVFGAPGTVVTGGVTVVVPGAVISMVPETGSVVPLETDAAGVMNEPVEALVAVTPLGLTATVTLDPAGVADETLWDPLESTCRHASLSIL